jgi:hypothetical protein
MSQDKNKQSREVRLENIEQWKIENDSTALLLLFV